MTASGPVDGVPLFWLAAILLRRRRMIARITAVGVMIVLAVALLRPARYTTSFSFLPQKAADQAQADLASLAGQFGLSLGARDGSEESPDFYSDLLTTRRVLTPIAVARVVPASDGTASMPLAQYLRTERGDSARTLERTMRELRDKVISSSVAKRTTGVVTVRVRTKSAGVSLDIAQRLIDGLSEYNLRTRQSRAREERLFTEGRLEASRASLRAAEDDLQRFLQANQRGESPALTFQRERLEREVRLREQVATSLAQRYEENRIREVRDTPVMTLIELPVLAARPDPRGRVLLMLAGTVASLALGVVAAVLATLWSRDGGRAPDPGLAELKVEWGRLRRQNPT